MQFEGIYTPVVTPYHNDYSINRQAFEAVIEFLIASGVHGIIIAGTTGEYYAQTTGERVELMRLARDIIDKRLPMIVGTGAIRTEDSVHLPNRQRPSVLTHCWSQRRLMPTPLAGRLHCTHWPLTAQPTFR